MSEPVKKQPKKIMLETQVYWHKQNSLLTWGDIKNLNLQDNDIIRSSWEQSDTAEYGGYYHCEIIRMVEETHEQYKKRMDKMEQKILESKAQRFNTYLELKKEFQETPENNSNPITTK